MSKKMLKDDSTYQAVCTHPRCSFTGEKTKIKDQAAQEALEHMDESDDHIVRIAIL